MLSPPGRACVPPPMSTHRLQQLQRASLVRARERPQDSTALAPRPGAHRHAWHPPPPPPSPPALTDEEKRSRLHYLRVAKTGSSAALRYFQLTNCSRRVHFHENHMDMQVPSPQRSVVVLREPCDRAGSMLSHLLGLYPASPNRTASRYWSRDYNHSLRLSHRTSLLELAAFVAASGISHTRVAGRHHAAVFFAQSRYVGPHTQERHPGFTPLAGCRSQYGWQQSAGLCSQSHFLPHSPLCVWHAGDLLRRGHGGIAAAPVQQHGTTAASHREPGSGAAARSVRVAWLARLPPRACQRRLCRVRCGACGILRGLGALPPSLLARRLGATCRVRGTIN